MVVDERGFCWVGDKVGFIRVLMFDMTPFGSKVELKVQLTPPQAQVLRTIATCHGPAAATAVTKMSLSSRSSTSSASGGSSMSAFTPAPITAMCSRGLAVFSSGGKSSSDITVWHSQKLCELEVFSCENFGAIGSFAILPWDAPEEAAEAGRASSGASDSSPTAQTDSSTAVGGAPASSIATGYHAGEISPLAKLAAAAVPPMPMVGPAAAADTSKHSSWCLLSGHERGQVLLLQFKRVTPLAGTSRLLQPLCVFGEPHPQYAVRGMAVFDDPAMLIVAHADGELTAMPKPGCNNLPISAGTSRVMAGAASVPYWEPLAARVKAHKSPIVATSCLVRYTSPRQSSVYAASWLPGQPNIGPEIGCSFCSHGRCLAQLPEVPTLPVVICDLLG
eukprot:GHUV01029252.1.p1 GENE.GHUV01029252.1~~GHUV01029252.1.p1  ORF type:complete len:391 (+),score=98.07 GHUV01029252.1:629-1801(+)